MTECGDDRGGSGSDGVTGEAVFAIGVEPPAAVHGVGLHGQIEPDDIARVETGDQWCIPGEGIVRARHTQRMTNLCGHDIQGELSRPLKGPPFIVNRTGCVGVIGVDRGLLKAADD